jgi:hypothetical protein
VSLDGERFAYYAAYYYAVVEEGQRLQAPTFADIVATARGVYLLPSLGARHVVQLLEGPERRYSLYLRGYGKCVVDWRPYVFERHFRGRDSRAALACVELCHNEPMCRAVDLSVPTRNEAACFMYLGREELLDYFPVAGDETGYPEPVTSWTTFEPGDYCLVNGNGAVKDLAHEHAETEVVAGARRRSPLLALRHRRRSILSNPNPDCTSGSFLCPFLAHRRRVKKDMWPDAVVSCVDRTSKGPKWCSKNYHRCWMKEVKDECPMTCKTCLKDCGCSQEIINPCRYGDCSEPDCACGDLTFLAESQVGDWEGRYCGDASEKEWVCAAGPDDAGANYYKSQCCALLGPEGTQCNSNLDCAEGLFCNEDGADGFAGFCEGCYTPCDLYDCGRHNERCMAAPAGGYRSLQAGRSGPTFDAATAPGLEGMAEYLCGCVGDTDCPKHSLCGHAGQRDYFFSLCTHWCGLLPGKCAGLLTTVVEDPTDGQRYPRCLLAREPKAAGATCPVVNKGDRALLQDFNYASISTLQSCQGGRCEDGSDRSSKLEKCFKYGRRLLQDEALFEADEDSEEFEADVLLEGMDVPVADT